MTVKEIGNKIEEGLRTKLDTMTTREERIEYMLGLFKESKLPEDLCQAIAAWFNAVYA